MGAYNRTYLLECMSELRSSNVCLAIVIRYQYRDKISVYLQRHPRAGEDTHLTSTQELVKIHNMCEDISI